VNGLIAHGNSGGIYGRYFLQKPNKNHQDTNLQYQNSKLPISYFCCLFSIFQIFYQIQSTEFFRLKPQTLGKKFFGKILRFLTKFQVFSNFFKLSNYLPDFCLNDS
jgi:hypothetical protein